MDKMTFLETLKTDRSQWEAWLAHVDDRQLMQPGVSGEMSMKDVVAHVTWYEREMVGVLKQRALVGSDLWDLSTDQRNAAIFEANRDRSPSDVREEAQQVFEQLVEALESLAGDELTDPAQFRDMPTDWIPWQVIASNSYEHYHQHIPDVRAWLEQQR